MEAKSRASPWRDRLHAFVEKMMCDYIPIIMGLATAAITVYEYLLVQPGPLPPQEAYIYAANSLVLSAAFGLSIYAYFAMWGRTHTGFVRLLPGKDVKSWLRSDESKIALAWGILSAFFIVAIIRGMEFIVNLSNSVTNLTIFTAQEIGVLLLIDAFGALMFFPLRWYTGKWMNAAGTGEEGEVDA